jgi:hypothetical protein
MQCFLTNPSRVLEHPARSISGHGQTRPSGAGGCALRSINRVSNMTKSDISRIQRRDDVETPGHATLHISPMPQNPNSTNWTLAHGTRWGLAPSYSSEHTRVHSTCHSVSWTCVYTTVHETPSLDAISSPLRAIGPGPLHLPSASRVRLLAFHSEQCMHQGHPQRNRIQYLQVETRQGCEASPSNATAISTERAIAYHN